MCDTQVVTTGTAAETYQVILAELQSVGALTWDDASVPELLRRINAALDKAGDNVAVAKAILRRIEDVWEIKGEEGKPK